VVQLQHDQRLSSISSSIGSLLRGAAKQALQFGHTIYFDPGGKYTMSDVLSAIERMEIERACERVTYAYGRALDLGDMNAAADCFAENGSFARPMNPGQLIQGREAIRTSLLTRPKTLLTKHLTTSVMIDVESRDAARGLSYLTMIATTPPEGAAPPFISHGPMYFGEMQDRFVREKGVWKFLERRGSIQMKFSGAGPQT
jgi:hypothetical protein